MSFTVVTPDKRRGARDLVRVGVRRPTGRGHKHFLAVAIGRDVARQCGLQSFTRIELAFGEGEHAGQIRIKAHPHGGYHLRQGGGKGDAHQARSLLFSTTNFPAGVAHAVRAPVICEHLVDEGALFVTLAQELFETPREGRPGEAELPRALPHAGPVNGGCIPATPHVPSNPDEIRQNPPESGGDWRAEMMAEARALDQGGGFRACDLAARVSRVSAQRITKRLATLRLEGALRLEGQKRGARWFVTSPMPSAPPPPETGKLRQNSTQSDAAPHPIPVATKGERLCEKDIRALLGRSPKPLTAAEIAIRIEWQYGPVARVLERLHAHGEAHASGNPARYLLGNKAAAGAP